MSTSVEGSCLCGALRFQVTLPVKWCAHCHCTMCQRAHGAPVVTWIGLPSEAMKWLAGEDHARFYRSSSDSERGFCDLCGSTLFFRSERWPGEIHIVRTAIQADIGQPPAVHVFYDSHAPWLTLGDSLPRLGGTSGMEPLGG
ncbi:MAG: GFA family protein [Polyangiaceae bacterium]